MARCCVGPKTKPTELELSALIFIRLRLRRVCVNISVAIYAFCYDKHRRIIGRKLFFKGTEHNSVNHERRLNLSG